MWCRRMVLVARADSPPPWTAVAARRQPQLRDGQKVRRRQLHGIGVRGLRTRARLAVAFAVSWRDASIESDLQVQLPGLLLVPAHTWEKRKTNGSQLC